MTWAELAAFLEREKAVLFGGTVPSLQILVQGDPVNIGDAFAQSDRRLKERLGQIVFEFACTGRWPELSPEEKVLLFQRLSFGIGISQSLARARTVGGEVFLTNLPDIPNMRAELIQWVLEYAWEDAGRHYSYALTASLLGHRFPPQDVPNN